MQGGDDIHDLVVMLRLPDHGISEHISKHGELVVMEGWMNLGGDNVGGRWQVYEPVDVVFQCFILKRIARRAQI